MQGSTPLSAPRQLSFFNDAFLEVVRLHPDQLLDPGLRICDLSKPLWPPWLGLKHTT
jgi:hypothetical protein